MPYAEPERVLYEDDFDVAGWLGSVGLQQYACAFEELDATRDSLLSMSDQVTEGFGVGSVVGARAWSSTIKIQSSVDLPPTPLSLSLLTPHPLPLLPTPC